VTRGIRTADRNGDGRPDLWRIYDSHGQLAEVDVDSNFDGDPDIQEVYERGSLVRRESDRNFNGQTDLVEEFDAETHTATRSVVDVDGDGTADLLVLFRDGRPVFSKRIAGSAEASASAANRPPASRVKSGRLFRLADPFESDNAVRRAHTSCDAGIGAIALAGAAPLPRAAVSRGDLSSVRQFVVSPQTCVPSVCAHPSLRGPPAV
jgi:hypothetical protein